VRLRAMLVTPLLGAGELAVQYELPTPVIGPASTVAEDLPMVLPAATRIGSQSVTLSVPETLSIDLRGDAWKRDAASLGSIAGRTWTTARAQESVPLAISARKRSRLGDTVVDAALLQTSLFGDRREDAYRYCIFSSASEITMSLPFGSKPPAVEATRAEGRERPEDAVVEVRLNGRRLPDAVRPDGRIVVDLPQRAGSPAWLLEVIASRKRAGGTGLFGATAGLPAAIVFDPPVFPKGTLQRRFYWEVFFESDEHPLGTPRGWTSQQRWKWGTGGIRRVPVVSRDVLSEWLAAGLAPARQSGAGSDSPADAARAAVAALPPDATTGTRLVFSGVGPPGQGRIWVCPTWFLVLAVSAPVLAGGLSAVYVPWLRGVPAVLGIASAGCLAAALFSELAPLVALAAVPGAALTVLAAVLRFLLHQGTPAVPARGPAAVVSASSLTQVAAQPSLIIAPSSPGLRDGVTAAARDLP
jgi:hypothetical protein